MRVLKTADALVMVLVALSVFSCKKSSTNQVSSVVAGPTPTAAAVHASNSCKSNLLDAGQKGSVASVARGSYSDTKMIPATGSPATVFVDSAALSIKISYWNGAAFSTEVISGEGAGASVRLAFFANGIPLVLWTQGVNLKAAIRTSALGSSGTWNAGTIDTGVAPRAIDVSINPNQQVAVSFLTDTAVTGRAKFLYCDSPCSGPSGFLTMSITPYIENTNLVAAEVATGVGWCKTTANTYYPAAVYGVTGATHYAVCMNNLSSCLNGTNWQTTSVVATGNLSSKLLLDSTLVGDVPKVVSLGAAGITPYKMGTTACSSPPAAFMAGTAMGSPTSGSQWISFLKDSASKFHLVANEGSTGVRYYNSTTVDPTAAWNAVGIVESVTLAAAVGGGADLDPSTSGLYTSYGQAAIPYDIRLSRVNDYTQTSNTATYSRYSPDTTGDLMLSASPLRQISTASTSTGVPAAAWIDFSIGAVANAKLKFALRGGATSSDVWPIELVPDTINPQFPSLIFDQSDLPWISYFDAGVNKFYLVTNSAPNGSGNWSTYEYPATPGGAPLALPAANHTALVASHFGGVVNPVMVVIDTNAATRGVKATVFKVANHSWSTTVVVDPLTSGALGASFLTAASSSAGVAIAYQDISAARAKFSSTADGVTYTTPLSLTAVNQGQGLSLNINPVSGSPAVTYFDMANNVVYFSSCSGTIATCGTSGWSPQQIDNSAGVSGLAATANQLVASSLNFDSLGAPYVFYPRGQGNDGNLILSSNTSAVFQLTLAGLGINGNLPGMAAMNFGIAGWGVSATRNASGSFTSVYLGPGNRIYSASCGD